MAEYDNPDVFLFLNESAVNNLTMPGWSVEGCLMFAVQHSCVVCTIPSIFGQQIPAAFDELSAVSSIMMQIFRLLNVAGSAAARRRATRLYICCSHAGSPV
jgi:hypothetical protein